MQSWLISSRQLSLPRVIAHQSHSRVLPSSPLFYLTSFRNLIEIARGCLSLGLNCFVKMSSVSSESEVLLTQNMTEEEVQPDALLPLLYCRRFDWTYCTCMSQWCASLIGANPSIHNPYTFLTWLFLFRLMRAIANIHWYWVSVMKYIQFFQMLSAVYV